MTIPPPDNPDATNDANQSDSESTPSTPSKIIQSDPAITQPPGAPPTRRQQVQPGPPSINPPSATPQKPPSPPRSVEHEPVPMAETTGFDTGASKITQFGKDALQRHEEQWNRTPNITGQGAIHVKTFRAKLTDDALAYMDQVINEWLDAHPEYEVKFVTSTVGILTGKLKEPNIITQIWV